jgi:hypothetical protein
VDVNAPIIAAHSLGGVALGSDVQLALTQAYTEGWDVQLTVYENPGIKLHSYALNRGTITINATEGGTVVSLSCQQPYRGTYEHKLWPSMSVAQIKVVTQKQMLTSGALVLDGELGIYFSLPAPYDEYDYFHQLPIDLVLEKVYVMDRKWRGY